MCFAECPTPNFQVTGAALSPILGNLFPNSKATYTCTDPLYGPASVITCDDKGTWSPPPMDCTLASTFFSNLIYKKKFLQNYFTITTIQT